MVKKSDLHALPSSTLSSFGESLDSMDLIKLLSSSSFDPGLLKDSHRIVTDRMAPPYSFLPSGFATDIETALDDPAFFSFKGTLLLEVHDMARNFAFFVALFEKVSIQTSLELTIYNSTTIPDEHQELFHLAVYSSSSQGGPIKSFHLPDLDILIFRNINKAGTFTWDCSLFKAPKITYMGLHGVKVKGLKKCHLDFPLLKDLTVQESLESDDGGDVKRLLRTPETLLLSDILQPLDLTGFKSSKVQFLKVELAAGIQSFQDIELPNLVQLEIINSNIEKLNNIKANNLLIFKFDGTLCKRNIVFDNIQAKSLKQLSISARTISGFENFQIPEKHGHAAIALESQPIPDAKSLKKGLFKKAYQNPFKFLQNFDFLELTNCLHLLEGQTLPNLTTLMLFDEFDYRLSSVKVPNLKILLMVTQTKQERRQSSGSETYQRVPVFIAPKLEHLSTMGYLNYERISDLSFNYPNLKRLIIGDCLVTSMSGLKFPRLEILTIESSANEFTFYNNEFPALLECEIKPHDETAVHLRQELRFEKIKAPKLQKLIIAALKIRSPITTKPYPLLEALALDWIDDLEVVSSKKLTHLELDRNPRITYLKLGNLDSLIGFRPPQAVDQRTIEWLKDFTIKYNQRTSTTTQISRKT